MVLQDVSRDNIPSLKNFEKVLSFPSEVRAGVLNQYNADPKSSFYENP